MIANKICYRKHEFYGIKSIQEFKALQNTSNIMLRLGCSKNCSVNHVTDMVRTKLISRSRSPSSPNLTAENETCLS